MKFHPLHPQRKAQGGSSLAEALVGSLVAAIGITGFNVALANCLGIARAHREAMIANQCVQQRAEQFRAASWLQLTDPSGLNSLLQQSSVNDGTLQSQTETVSVNAYPPVMPAITPLTINRDALGGISVLSQVPTNFSLRSATAIRIDFQESWTSAQGKRTRSKQSSMVIAFGGLLP